MAGMDREASANYLAGSLANWFTETGISATDDPGSLAEIIDDALLAIGTAYEDLAAAEVISEIAGYRKVLRYLGLLKIQSAYIRADVSLSTPGVSKRYGSVSDGLAKAVAAAKADADPFMATTGEWGTGTISLDFLEPVATW